MSLYLHKEVRAKSNQRVFFCGDIHGDWNALSSALKRISYLEGEDILICVGDLIDRGPESEKVLQFATCTPNVHSVIGNHEYSFLQATNDPADKFLHALPAMGGAWINRLSDDELDDLATLIRQTMPLAITMIRDDVNIGVIHAEAPNNWSEVLRPKNDQLQSFLWGRDQHYDAIVEKEHFVQGVDAVVHGHVCDHVTCGGNHIWIDTLYHTGQLTILEMREITERIS